MQLHIQKESTECDNVQNLLDYFQIKHKTQLIESDKTFKKGAYQAKSILSKSPLLEAEPNKFLNSYHSIVKFICTKVDSPLLGESAYDKILLDQYAEMLIPIESQIQSLSQNIAKDPQFPTSDNFTKQSEDLLKELSVFNKILKFSTFLGGNQVSYVDFLLFFALKQAKKVLPAKQFNELSNISRLEKFLIETGI